MSAESFSNARIEEVCRNLYAERKRKTPSNNVLNPKVSLTKRRLSKKYGLDFTIRGEKGTEWKMSLREAAVSALIEETCLQLANPVHSIDIPSRFDAGTIDLMVNFMLWGGYNIKENFILMHVEDADSHNDKLKTHLEKFVPIMRHIKARDLGEYMQIPELMDAALEHIQYFLSSRSNPLSLQVFKEVVQHTWGWEDTLMNEKDIDIPVAQMVATFGATLEPLWMLTNPELLGDFASFEGKCKTYALWHSEAKKYNDKMSRDAVAPFVRKLIDMHVNSVDIKDENKENM